MAPPTEASSAELRRRLRQIVDELPEQELQAAHRYLEYLRQMADPLADGWGKPASQALFLSASRPGRRPGSVSPASFTLSSPW